MEEEKGGRWRGGVECVEFRKWRHREGGIEGGLAPGMEEAVW